MSSSLISTSLYFSRDIPLLNLKDIIFDYMQKLPVRQAKPGILSIKTYPQNVDEIKKIGG